MLGVPSGMDTKTEGAEAGVESDTPPALGTADDAEASVEGNTSPALVELAFGSLQSLGGSFGTSDEAGAETDAPPSLDSDDRGRSDR